ncbi:hypothetical protein TNCV_5074251 [Trichonephila clavipes]|nr:hypothetical protein TNCV_5074251 [Trichonephila clavipes]
MRQKSVICDRICITILHCPWKMGLPESPGGWTSTCWSAEALNPHSAKYEVGNAIRNVEKSTIIMATVVKLTSAAKILGYDS